MKKAPAQTDVIAWMLRLATALRVNHMLDYKKSTPRAVRRWIEKHLRRIENEKRKSELLSKQKTSNKEFEQCMRNAVRFLASRAQDEKLGDYLEFGVYAGSSLASMSRVLKELEVEDVRLFGFDSFEGFPDAVATDDEGVWGRSGDYRSDYEWTVEFLNSRHVDWNQITLVKGWFSDTLNGDLMDKHNISNVSITLVDCDLYSSAKKALDFCAPLIRKETVIVFDDWHYSGLAERNMGEKRAFDEFLNDNSHLSAQKFENYGRNSEVFLVRNCLTAAHTILFSLTENFEPISRVLLVA
jgi:O-methyltransferase